MTANAIKKIVELLKSGDAGRAITEIDHVITKHGQTQVLLQLRAESFRKSGNDAESADTYKKAAIFGGKNSVICWYNAGVQYQKILNLKEAIDSYKKAIELDPTHHPSRNNLCVLLYQNNRSEEAIQYAKWLSSHSDNAEHLVNAGFVLRGTSFYDEADSCFKRALAFEPNNWKVIAAALQSSQYVCDWNQLDSLINRYHSEIYSTNNFSQSRELHHVHIAWCDDEKTNVEMARDATSRLIGNIKPIYSHAGHKTKERIKIGYVSSDFFNHATLHLIIGVLEYHNKEKFEIFAYCHSQNDHSSYRKRFLNAIDHFRDISKLNDDEAASLINQDNIDVLIDLKGFTDKNRLKIFAKRPAPLQVTYIGYPGTSGADFFDYVITDKIVTPDSSKLYYTERLCRLPESYQCNDNKRIIASNVLRRIDYGLPENAFVFCCFNQSYKIEAKMFNAWVEILKKVDRSVLWILDPGSNALKRLQSILEQRGLDKNRIILAEKEPPPIHLKRLHDFADLALDTRIVNGHTTTSDALWAGVPVVTLYGNHFNSRVSSTLLSAAGLSELVTYTLEEFVTKCVDLGNQPIELKRIKSKLAAARFIEPLFDTERFARHFEMGIELMVENYKGNKIDHIDVPALPRREEPFSNELKMVHVNFKGGSTKEDPEILNKLFAIGHECPLCRSEESKMVRQSLVHLEFDKKEHQFRVPWYSCNSCGHVFKKRMLNEEGRDAVPESPVHPFKLSRKQSFEIIQDASSLLNIDNRELGLKILEVYPSDPMLFATGLEFGNSMSAVVEPKFLDIFKKMSQSVIASDFLKINIKGSPDLVNFGRFLENSINPKTFVAKASEIINENELVAVVFSNRASLEWINLNKQDACGIWDQPAWNQIFNRQSLIKIFSDFDMKLVQCKPIEDNQAGVIAYFRKQLKGAQHQRDA